MHKAVYVVWRDSNATDRWQPAEGALARAQSLDLQCESAGLLLECTKDQVSIYRSATTDGESLEGVLTIPAEAVVAIYKLEPGRKMRVLKK